MRVSFIHPNLYGELIPNIGLAYLMTVTEKNHKISLIDLTFHRTDWKAYVKRMVRKTRPKVIALSCLTFNFNVALQVATYIKDLDADISTIFGGIHPTLLPREVLKHKIVDAICIGEGEETFQEYLNHIEKGISLKGVKGIWYKENGKIVHNELRPLISDLDTLPFPNWDLWELDKYLNSPSHMKFMEMLGSRGCPYHCTYCSNHALQQLLPGTYVRFRSAENIIAEIKLMKKRYYKKGFQFINFWDEIFGLNKKIFEQFCKLYINERLHEEIFWTCNNRADLITNQWAQLVKSAGCFLIRIGIEAGNEYIRNKIYKKNITNKQILDATKILKKHDLLVRFNLMLGGPHETIATMTESLQLVKRLKPDAFFFSIFQPLPKTEILEEIDALHGKINYHGWRNNPNFLLKSLIDYPHLKSKDIEKFNKRITLNFIWNFFWQGLFHRKFTFIKDLAKFLLVIKPQTHILLQYLVIYTIRKYQIEDWIRRNTRFKNYKIKIRI
ncbi:MAG: B12-binding domain-containing radical SAM protein [Candidatus Helarchaeota archaeon]